MTSGSLRQAGYVCVIETPLLRAAIRLIQRFLRTPQVSPVYRRTMLKLSIVLLAAVTFLLFGAALRIVFAHSERTPLATRLLVGAGVACSCLHLYLLWTAHLEARSVRTGAVFYLLACVLFVWTAQSVQGRNFRLAYVPGTPAALFRGGPYRWVRHPFYLSYTLGWCAGVVALSDWRLLITPSVMLAFYVAAAFAEERQMLHGPMATEYRAYRRDAGVLLPTVRGLARALA
jgi:protein-S-isoprenylcysteine O-methyltransferase Ste14